MLATLRIQVTASAALRRPAAIRANGTNLRAAALRSTYSWGNAFGGSSTFGTKPEPCRMPSVGLALDPSSHQEGDP